MHIVILVLKIIGIVLLCILGLVLLILAALLFAPFRYEADISGDLQKKALSGKAYVRWLLRIVSFKTDIISPKDIRYTLRVFGIPVKRGTFGNDEEEETSSEESAETAETGEKPEAAAESVSQDAAEETVAFSEEQNEETSEEAKPEEETSEEQAAEEQNAEEQTSEETGPEDEKKPGIRKRIKDKADQLKAKASSLLDSVRALFELLRRKKGLLVKYIRKKSTKRALKTAWVNVKWILLHIAPKKYNGELSFGLQDPSLTGSICGLISPIYVQIADKLQLYPDFEGELKVGGHGYMKGRIRLWGILIRALRLYRDKNIRKVIDEAQKVKETIVATPDEAKQLFENAA